jgi:hypothetical protein
MLKKVIIFPSPAENFGSEKLPTLTRVQKYRYSPDGGPIRIHEKVVTRLSLREIYKVAAFRGKALDELRFLKFRLISRIYRPKMVRGRIIVRP